MNIDDISVGVDIEENCRFENKTPDKDEHFLKKIFTEKEIEYCFSNGIASQHLCVRFCAKEAVVKALCNFGITDVYYTDIEIINDSNGMPFCMVEKYPHLEVKLSLSHSKVMSVASVVLIRKSE